MTMRRGERNRTGDAMPRLRDKGAVAPSSSEEWAVDLVRASGPYEAPAGRKQRVQLGLRQSSSHRAPPLLRPVIVGAVLIGCGALASAALGHWPGWVVRAYERFVPAATPTRTLRTASLAEPRPHARLPAEELPVAVAAAAAPTVGTPSPVASSRSRRVTAPAGGEDTSAVLEAMRALRLQGNPVRARALLAKYLDRHPNGTLAEEALAMSIEAAVAHHDPDAAALGARYLRLYPTGPFRGLAHQTVSAAAAAPVTRP